MAARTSIASGSAVAAALGACALAWCGAASPATAQSRDDELEAMRRQLGALQSLVEEQAKRIEALEADEAARSKAPPLERIETPDTGAPLRSGPVSRQPIGRFPDDAIVTAGDFEGSIRVPGQDASVRIGGFIRAEGNYDIDSMGFQDIVSPRRIPLDGSVEDETNQSRFHVRQSRFNIDYRRDTRYGPLRTLAEFDFFGGGNEFINAYEVRVRHAAAQLGNLYVGQWWSYFTDVQSVPEGADFGGPMGSPLARNPGVRWAQNVGDSWRWGVGVENPAGDLSGPDALLASDQIPNFTGFVQLTQPWGRVRVAGLGLQLDSTEDSVFTGGVNLTGRLNMPFLGEQDNLVFGVQAGEGFTHYYSAYSGAGLEGVVDETGVVEATGILGGYLAYQHFWTKSVRSTFEVSAFEFDSPAGSSASAFDSGERYMANLFWTPVDGATFGLEAIHAAQQTVAAGEGDGLRIHAVARIDF